MHFSQILSECIEAVAQGQSVDATLALHPDYAEELAPLLHLVASIQNKSTKSIPRLSDGAFQQGRAALADAARRKRPSRTPIAPPLPAYQQTQHRRFVPYRDLLKQAGAHVTPPSTVPPLPNGLSKTTTPPRGTHPATHRHRGQSRLTAGRRDQRHARTAHTDASKKQPSGLYRLRQFVTVLLPVFLILTTATLLRQAAISTPGSPLYGLKTASEQSQGLLMTAAGEGATWHANLMLRRLDEWAQLITAPAPTGAPFTAEPAVATLAASVAARATMHADQALAAGALLPPADQRVFLLHWLTELEKIEQTLQQTANPSAEALVLVQKTKSAVIAATVALDDATNSPDRNVPAVESTASAAAPTALPSPEPSTEPSTATIAVEPIVTPVTPLPTATRVLKATAIPTPTRTPVQIQSVVISPTTAPTTVLTATPLPIITQAIPLERQSGNQSDEEPSDNNRASTDGTNGPGTDNSGADNSGTDRSNNGGTEQDSGSAPTNPDSDSPASDNSADDVTATAVPTGAAAEETLATAIPPLPTTATALPEPTGLSSVDPEMTISAPEPSTPLPTTIDPGHNNDATATPAPQSTGIILDEVPVPIVVTGVPPVTSVPTVPTPTRAEGEGPTEAPPTRTRRPTSTPTPTPAISVPATRTPELSDPIFPTDAPSPIDVPVVDVPVVDVTAVAEPTDSFAP